MAFLAVLLSACQRGCLKQSLPDVDGGSVDPLSVVDCPPGILRCRTGVVERHASATACRTCACPWVATPTTCEHGCLVEEMETPRSEEDAVSLCNPASSALIAFAPDAPPDAGARGCVDEGARFECAGSVVYACAASGGVPVATCAHGCVVEGDSVDDDEIDVARARALMCRRHAIRGDP